MNERIKNKVLEIMALAVEFNNTATKTELTDDKPTFFVNFSGHICELEVNIHPEGWSRDKTDKTKYLETYLDKYNAEENLDSILSEMKNTISNWENKNNESA